MLKPLQKFIDLDFKMHLRVWEPDPIKADGADGRTFLLIHGLSSNAQTWDAVGRLLAQAGHRAVAIDQRNHGLSGKVECGFDFETVTADVAKVLDILGWEKPILLGQSWGGNVLTAFGANYPGRSAGLVMVDGGFLDFGTLGESWEQIQERLKPADVDRFPAETMRYFIQSGHPDWTEEGIDGTMANFKVLDDGLIRRHLEIPKHLQILRHMFDQRPQALYPQIQEPVLVCVAASGDSPEPNKVLWLEHVQQIKKSTIKLFKQTDHDIHIHKPDELVQALFSWIESNQI